MDHSEQLANASLAFLKEMVRKGPFRGSVYLAGGAVRDMQLGKLPKDLDIVVVGHINGGIDFTIWLAKEMGNYSESSNPVIFPKFGTSKVNLNGEYNGICLKGMEVEAVTSRRETYTPGNRKPIVTPGTLKDDVYRRDFTVNSLVMDLTTDEILDLTGNGKNDIGLGLLRTTSTPDVIFREDPLRMLRAIRFMAQKGWTIDIACEQSIRDNAEWLNSISKERIRDEINKILVTDRAAEAFQKLRDVNLLPIIFPELHRGIGMTQNRHHIHDVFDHTMEVVKNTQPRLIQRLIALLHDIGKIESRSETDSGIHFYGHEIVGAEMADRILRDLKYPTEIINVVKKGVLYHMRLKHGGKDGSSVTDKTLRKLKIELGEDLNDILDVIHSDNIAHAENSAMPYQISKIRERISKLDLRVTKPSLPINGNDLIAMGIPSGPLIGKAMSVVTDAWFENPNITREDAILLAKKVL